MLAAFLCMCIQLLILGCRDGGTLHFESVFFFMNYMDGRTFLKGVFDPFHNDWGLYQARELSYLFDALDAHFVAFLLKKRIVWFHSIVSLLLCGGMVFIQHYYTRKFFPKIPGITVTLLSVFFVLTGTVTGLDYFRTAKYLTAFGLWGALFAAYASYRYGNTSSRTALLFSLLLMVLSDRQGFFFTAALCGTAALLMLLSERILSSLSAARMRIILFSAGAMTVFGVFNNLFLTPALIRLLNGYSPDFTYQASLRITPESIKNGFFFLTGNAGSWFSSYTGEIRTAAVTGMLLLGGVMLYLWYGYRKGRRRCIPLGLLWFCALGAMLICASAMAGQHDQIMLPDVVYGTYAINFLVIVMFLLTLTAAGGKFFCRILFLLICIGIVLRIGVEAAGGYFVPESTSFRGYNSRQYLLKECLRDPAAAGKNECMPHRMELFLEFCRKNILTKP